MVAAVLTTSSASFLIGLMQKSVWWVAVKFVPYLSMPGSQGLHSPVVLETLSGYGNCFQKHLIEYFATTPIPQLLVSSLWRACEQYDHFQLP